MKGMQETCEGTSFRPHSTGNGKYFLTGDEESLAEDWSPAG